MKPKIAIGLTTYLDITDPAFGAAVYDAYAAASARVTPNQVRVWSQKHSVTSRDEFAGLWLTRSPFEVHADRRKTELLKRGVSLIGAEWRHIGSPSGEGSVHFRPETDTSRANTVSIEHNWATGVDWVALFRRLIETLQPSYAMMHLFTEAELEAAVGRDRFDRFDGPVVGEGSFTSWKSIIGDWRGPDSFDHAARRQYRFLPELSWANWFGPEFDGRYERDFLAVHAANVVSTANGFGFQVTDSLRDVEQQPDEFRTARERLKSAFAADVFRSSSPS